MFQGIYVRYMLVFHVYVSIICADILTNKKTSMMSIIMME